jgi:uridine kinase
MDKPLVIGIAGGTGSGKTTVAEMIAKDLGQDRVVLISQDSYYRDLSHLPVEDRAHTNFDHPDAVDAALMAAHIRKLRAREPIEKPVYDFTVHTRKPGTERVAPRDILLVEGILILAIDEVRELLDIKVYIDTDDDLRFIRRLKRDIHERGRDVDSVISQYLGTVRPMHDAYVEASRRRADIVLPWHDFNPGAVGMVITMLRGFVDL